MHAFQLITNRHFETTTDVTVSTFDRPKSLDSYDFNIIDLSETSIWKKNVRSNHILMYDDCRQISEMVTHKKNSIIIFVLPQDTRFEVDNSGKYLESGPRLKNAILKGVDPWKLSGMTPDNMFCPPLLFEPTETILGENTYKADFYFEMSESITVSCLSNKQTTVKVGEDIFCTSLSVCDSLISLKEFLENAFIKSDSPMLPDWASEVTFGSDEYQLSIIRENKSKIELLKNQIELAEEELRKNERFKSILWSDGNQLVDVVFDILESIFECNLEDFVDERKEDFLIKKADITFIGEIKGVNSNVKYSHIAQVNKHKLLYLDKLQEEGKRETVKEILIVNSQKNKKPSEREGINEDQIELAKKYEVAIISTETLLRIFEKRLKGIISADMCISVFETVNGLIELSNFIEG